MYSSNIKCESSYCSTSSQVTLVVKNLPANAGDGGDTGSVPGPGRSPGEGNGNPLQSSCLQNPMDSKPGGLQSIRFQRVSHDWSNLAHVSNIILYMCTTSLSVPLLVVIFVAFILGYCKQCCSDHWGACILLNDVFLLIHAQECDCWINIKNLYF